jgi:hypothetical protein
LNGKKSEKEHDMKIFKTGTKAYKAGGDETARLNMTGELSNCGFRVIRDEDSDGFTVMMFPDMRWNPEASPYYL